MNKVIYVEVFTTVADPTGSTTWVRFRRDNGNHKHETHVVNTVRRADQINKLLRKSFDISGATVGPWGILSIVWYPKPTGKVIEAREVKLLDPNENPPDDWEECPVCNSYHPLNYAGDCRDDVNRWPFNPILVDNVRNYLNRNQYINAIKYYRMETGASLQEGKQFIDRFLDR